MTLDSILAFVRDVAVIGYMFVLRIGVPLLITLMIGAWLRRLLEEHEPQPAEELARLGPDQHCWDVKRSAETDRAKTLAAQRPDLPCWLAMQVGGAPLSDMCRSCPVYARQSAVPATVKP